jgi:hypothetical protein
MGGWFTPVDQGEHGDDDGQQHPAEHPEDQHPGQRDHGQGEVAEAEQAGAAEGGRVDQADHGHDDHRPQGGLGQVLEQRGQEQQGEDHDQGGGDAGELAAGARPAIDGRLGQAPSGREGLEAAAGQVGGAERPQLLVGVDLGVVVGGEGPGGRDRLDEGQVGQLIWPRLARAEPILAKKSSPFWGTPRILPSWPAAISSPVPALNPAWTPPPAPGPGRRRPPRPRRPRSGRPGSRWC